MKASTDVDIDVAYREEVLEELPHVVAKIDRETGVEKHKTGVYVQAIPFDAMTNMASLDYKEAEDKGYFKIDFLNVHLYRDVKDESHLNALLHTEPDWSKLCDPEFTKQLFHLGKYVDLVRNLRPSTLLQLAAVLAIIRPSKRYLQDSDWNIIEKEVWLPPEDGSYYFKKSHSIAYAAAVIVQMNILTEED